MTIASTAFSVLPIMGYAVASVLVAYIAIRAYGYVRQRRDQSVALPRPVYETAPKKSFPFVRTNGRNWQIPVPWTRSTAGSSFKSKAASIASAKELSLELLPTTALPPPPTSIPTSPPLVDLSAPSALEASTGSRFSISLPSSPKQQSQPLLQQQPLSPHSAKGHRNIQYPTFPRPPSPHALLATTPPQRHTRSRSLGGVPVRRLSSGQSGLRNKVDVELGYVRASGKEDLLIDFESSSDDVEEDMSTGRKPEPDNSAWMWFNNAPSTITSYDARVLARRPQSASFSKQQTFAFPLPLPFQKTEKLVDIPSNEDARLELDSLDSSATLVELESDVLGKKDQPNETSVDVRDFLSVTADPFSDDYAVDCAPYVSRSQVQVHCNGDLVQDDQDSLLSPLVDIESQVQKSPVCSPLSEVDVTLEGGRLDFADSQTLSETRSSTEADENSPWVSVGPSLPSTLISPTPSPVSPIEFSSTSSAADTSSQLEQTPEWRWAEADDPWGDHVPIQDETLGTTYDETTHSGPVTRGRRGVMESSPGGSLLATVLAGETADDEVPHLSLDGPSPPEALQLMPVDDDEEDATPRPTPLSINIQLPGSDDGASLLIFSVGGNTDYTVCDVSQNTQAYEQAIGDENYPDPDLLPLPEYNLPSSNVEATRMSAINLEDDSIKIEPRPSSQMPTPPASPPSPFSSALPNMRKTGKSLPSSPITRPKNLSVAIDVTRNRSRSSSPLTLQTELPPVASRSEPLLTRPGSESIDVPLSGNREDDVVETSKEAGKPDEVSIHKETPTSQTEDETSIPGSLPETLSLATSIASKTTQTVAVRLAEKSRPAPFHPSVRAIIRQPVEIALAMQLRPGLGAGADPAWMVRFLMAMFGWFAVLVSGQDY